MLLNLNLPDRKHIHEDLDPFSLEHYMALNYLINLCKFSAQAACDEINELNFIQATLISALGDKKIPGNHLRSLQMNDSFEYPHRELFQHLNFSGLSSEEICKILRKLSVEEAEAMNIALFTQLYPSAAKTTLLWQCVAFFGSRKINTQTREDLIKDVSNHVGEKIRLAARVQ